MTRWAQLTDIRSDHADADTCLFLITLQQYEHIRWYLDVKAYRRGEEHDPAEDRIRLEEENRDRAGVQVALVAVQSIDTFRRAYPNYYADTTEFLKQLQVAIYSA